MLSYQDRSRIFFHLRVPVQGVNMIGFALGARFNQVVGNLYQRLNDLQSYEEVQLTGNAISALRIWGNPVAGDHISATVTPPGGAPATAAYDVLAADLSNPILALYTIASKFSIALTAAANAPTGIMASAGPDPGFAQYVPKVAPPFAEVALQSVESAPFAVTAAFVGNTMIAPLSQGAPSEPHLDVTKPTPATIYGFIPILDYLYAQVGTAQNFAAFDQAETVKFRPEEAALRNALYKFYRKGLSDLLGIPVLPMGRANRAPYDT